MPGEVPSPPAGQKRHYHPAHGRPAPGHPAPGHPAPRPPRSRPTRSRRTPLISGPQLTAQLHRRPRWRTSLASRAPSGRPSGLSSTTMRSARKPGRPGRSRWPPPSSRAGLTVAVCRAASRESPAPSSSLSLHHRRRHPPTSSPGAGPSRTAAAPRRRWRS